MSPVSFDPTTHKDGGGQTITWPLSYGPTVVAHTQRNRISMPLEWLLGFVRLDSMINFGIDVQSLSTNSGSLDARRLGTTTALVHSVGMAGQS